MSLQLAVKYENAVLDLKVLHEASVMNRKDTIEALDELKQRILLTEPLPRTLPGQPESSRHSRDSFESVQTSRSSASSAVPPKYVPKAVRIPAEGDSKNEKTGLARYFSMQRRSSKSSITAPKSLNTASGSTNFHPALNHLLQEKGPEERKKVMKDIDEIIAAYQGLRVEGDRAEALHMLTGKDEATKRDTLAVLHGGNGYQRDTMGLNRDALELLKHLPPTPGEHRGNSEYPAANHNIFVGNEGKDDRRWSEWMDHPRSAPESRWSTTSASSSVYSEHTVCSDPPSLYRNDSTSSRGSPILPIDAQRERQHLSNHPNSVYSTVPFWPLDRVHYPPSYSPNSSHPSSRSNSIAPLSIPPQVPPQVPPKPSFTSQRPRTPTKEVSEGSTVGRTRVHLVPGEEYTYKADPSVKLHPPLSIQRLGSQTNIATVQTTITTTAQEKMMDGRPCKDNNYWGFCKGAWATREDFKKGLGLGTRPEGLYNTSQIWQCKHCCFEGPSFTVPHPTKKNKKEVVIDPNIHTSAVGIRYRWIFLAKSHVKKKTIINDTPRTAGARKGAGTEDGDCSYGCVICSVEGKVTGIYGNVETLMNHIFMEHVRPGSMSETTMMRSKCVVGRTAESGEEWDLNASMEGVLLF